MPTSSTQPRLALRLTWARRPSWTARSAIGPFPTATMTLRGTAWWPAAVALGHPVHRARLLHLLTRTDRIALLEQGRERRPRAFHKLILKLLGKIGESHIGMNRLNVP